MIVSLPALPIEPTAVVVRCSGWRRGGVAVAAPRPRVLLLVVMLVATLLTRGAVVGEAQEGSFRLATLANGMRVIARARPDTTTVALQLWVGVGSRHDPGHRDGLSHLLKHVVLKGSDRVNAFHLARTMASIGGQLGGDSSREFTRFHAHTRDRDYAVALELMREVVFHPALAQDEIEREKKVVLGELRHALDLPDERLEGLAIAVTFGQHPLARPIRGTAETLAPISREEVLDFYRQFYRPANMVLVAVGNFHSDRLLAEVEERFGRLGTPPFPPSLAPGGNERTTPPPIPLPRGRTVAKGFFQQARVALAVPTSGVEGEERYALELLSGLVQLHLFDRIRRGGGLAYQVEVHFDPFVGAGVWRAVVGTQEERLPEVERLLVQELSALRGGELTEEEILAGKRHLRGQLLRRLETNRQQAYSLGWAALHHLPLSPSVSLEGIEQVSRAQVMRVLRRYFVPERFRWVVLRPVKGLDKLWWFLKRGGG